jgi:uncharacterized protein with PIN domain
VPYPTGQRPPRRRRQGYTDLEDFHDMLKRPTVTCEDCGMTYWEGYGHAICTKRVKGEYL